MKKFWMLACLMIVCAGSSAFGGQPPVADCEKAHTIRQQVASNESMPSDVKKSLLDKAARLCPGSVDVSGLLGKAEGALAKGKFQEALEQLENAVALNPQKAGPKVVEMAKKLAARNQVGSAVTLYETALSSYQDKNAYAAYKKLLEKAPGSASGAGPAPALEAKGPGDLISKDTIIRSLRAKPIEIFPENSPGGPSRVVFHNILFRSGSAELKPDSKGQLDELGQALSSEDLAQVDLFYVDGHTDSIGTVDNNCDLGYQRARSVIAFITKNWHVSVRKLVPRSYGQNDPVASNSNAGGRSLNRRVVVLNGNEVHQEDSAGRERCR